LQFQEVPAPQAAIPADVSLAGFYRAVCSAKCHLGPCCWGAQPELLTIAATLLTIAACYHCLPLLPYFIYLFLLVCLEALLLSVGPWHSLPHPSLPPSLSAPPAWPQVSKAQKYANLLSPAEASLKYTRRSGPPNVLMPLTCCTQHA